MEQRRCRGRHAGGGGAVSDVAASARARANAAQRSAADPSVSAFVAASAGSGKTKLLTDRLLRLMLAGADPARILCLTYTKAAAAEMALRLQQRLGAWAVAEESRLDADLAALGLAADAASRHAARGLFARVLDLPEGMRIATIHAFCQSLLQRFPLEAGLSPHFRLLEEHEAHTLRQDAREAGLARVHADPSARAALARLAGMLRIETFDGFLKTLAADPGRLAALRAGGLDAACARIAAVLDVPVDVLAGAGGGPGLADIAAADRALAAALAGIAQRGPPGAGQKAADGAAMLAAARAGQAGGGAAEDEEAWLAWLALFMKADGEPRQISGIVGKTLLTREPALGEAVAAEIARIEAIKDRHRAIEAARDSAALLRLAGPALEAYAQRKSADSALEFGDLIGHAQALLADPGAAWVLYKLDGGIDHLLLDEVQDTAPAQWRIVEALTADFFAGDGVDRHPGTAPARSLFAVGDAKQSIFSFQGADAGAFAAAQARLAARAEGGGRWRDVGLDVSFRSAPAVLDLVDAVFADPDAAAGVSQAGTLRHLTVRAEAAGSVELWPLFRPEPVDEAHAVRWQPSLHNRPAPTPARRLAQRLAGWIAAETGSSGGTRSLDPGQVLILVRTRSTLVPLLVRALKDAGVPVAGQDRMVLHTHPAVADLLALADALLLAQDELSLACFLTSPLGGLDDAGLMALAMGREGSLLATLLARADERPDWAAAAAMFRALSRRVDHAGPYAILAEALGPLGGRARLLARFGPEAVEPLDEVLAVARAYETAHPASMQGFLHWLRRSGTEAKRENEAAGTREVRIMTVHGAKGLQAPLVILPDTLGGPRRSDPLQWAMADGRPVPLLIPAKGECPRRLTALLAARQAALQQEENRLLYVALTRAEDRLVIAGAIGGKPSATEANPPEQCWYAQAARGFARLPTHPVAIAAGEKPALRHASGETAPLLAAQAVIPRAVIPRAAIPRAAITAPIIAEAEPEPALPAWLGHAPLWRATPPPAEPAPSLPLAPSRPDGVADGPVPQSASPLDGGEDGAGASRRFRRGALLHALLQHLPAIAPAARRARAQDWLARPGHELGDQAPALAEECLRILEHPVLAPLFGPAGRAEVPLSGVIGGRVVGGMIDRLAVLPERVLIADFKTNRSPPRETPVLYLRQMAAYRSVLRLIYPDRPVICALIWTRGAQIDILAPDTLDAHDPSHAVSSD
ncbi:MAG: double-strand break repair helicase AddA [Rhodospirillales bacterium]|nr:double-strand break repair helicase AddA [Rhodospirillales bacterium]